MTNFRTAPLQVALEVKRRLAKTNPAARMDEEAVKLAPIPGTLFDATIFLFQEAEKLKLIVELARPDVPHIFYGSVVRQDSRRDIAAKIMHGLLCLSARIQKDPRFARNVITINGRNGHG